MPKTRTYTDIWTDSRKVTKGSLFICLPGIQSNGEAYIVQAIRNGASEIIYSQIIDTKPLSLAKKHAVKLSQVPKESISGLTTRLLKKQYPLGKKIQIIAITGTDGKSSVVHFCRELAGACGKKSASIGTLGIYITDNKKTKELSKGTLTTPDQATIFQNLYKLSRMNVLFVFIEYSSVGIHQGRMDGIPIYGAVFTTFGSDHLDYHLTLSEYRKQKNRLFSEIVDSSGFSIIHEKVPQRNSMQHAAKHVRTIKNPATHYAPEGLRMLLTQQQLGTQLFATFLTENLNTAMETCRELGIDAKKIHKAVSNIKGPSGRFEVITQKNKPLAIVDYAHTPDGVQRLLEETLLVRKELHKKNIILVIGSGGNRDTTKRPVFGKLGSEYADTIIVTDDNPRYEKPSVIRQAIIEGIPKTYKGTIKNIPTREKAIAWAVRHAKTEDIIVLAGKGHEDYQLVKDKKIPFNDKTAVTRFLKGK